MDYKAIVITAIENITGAPAEDLENETSFNLRESGILDSLSCATLASALRDKIGRKFKSDKMTLEDFTSVDTILAAISRIMK